MAETTPQAGTPAAAPPAPANPIEGAVAANPAPGKKLREYETIFLVSPELADDNVDKLAERLRAVVHREGGKVIRISNWGKKKTSYPVKKHARAVYLHVLYLGNPGIVGEFERNLRMTDDVLKYQTVKLDDEVAHEGRAVEADVKLQGDADLPERPVAAREDAAPAAIREDPEAVAAEEPTPDELA